MKPQTRRRIAMALLPLGTERGQKVAAAVSILIAATLGSIGIVAGNVALCLTGLTFALGYLMGYIVGAVYAACIVEGTE